MHSQNTSTPDLGARVLGATLARVRERRTAHHRAVGSAAAVLFTVAAVAWTLTRPDVDPASIPNIATNVPGTEPAITIERIGERPLQLIERVAPSTPSAIQRIPGNRVARIPTLTDDQLLAAIPPDQPAGVVRSPNGVAHLVLFP